MKNPPFELTSQIVSLVAEIAELVGQVSSADRLSANPALRRSNRIRTVYGSLIKASLMEGVNMSDEMSDAPKDKVAERWKQIERFLENHDVIQNADVRQICGVSAATANRILSKLAAEGKLMKCREGGHWAYRRGRF